MPTLIQRLTRDRNRRPFVLPSNWPTGLGVAALVVWLLYLFVFSEQGVVRILSMRQELSRLEARNRVEESRVRQVDGELQRVRTDPFYSEKYVRESTGMVRAGEIVYRVVPESIAQQALEAKGRMPVVKTKPR